MDTNIVQSTEETTLSKDSVALSLLHDAGEMVVQDSFPEELNLDAQDVQGGDIIEGKIGSKESKIITNICG